MAFAARAKPTQEVIEQPEYQLASLDLSEKWLELVRSGSVEAIVETPVIEGDGSTDLNSAKSVRVRYGVKISDGKRCQEFVVQEEDGTKEDCERIRIINETLSVIQCDPTKASVQYNMDEDFVAQLQLVRTLRPPPSPGFAGSTSSEPPPYDAETDSFITGPLRLELRPLVGTIEVPRNGAKYDIYHNVSPADTRGHFLLIPSLSLPKINNRCQKFLPADGSNTIRLASSIRPHGSLFLGYNSVGAGASQNHIHCHIWPCPPLPLLNEQDEGSFCKGWKVYAVSKVKKFNDFYHLDGGNIRVKYLKYPLFCVQLSASQEHLDSLANALQICLDAIKDAPYNIGFLNRPAMDEDGKVADPEDSVVDIYLFARSKERSSILPSLKLGISEAMGLFHAQSESELEMLSTMETTDKKDEDEAKTGPMARALEDISHESSEELWSAMKAMLLGLDFVS